MNEAKELTEKSPTKKSLSQSQGSKKSSQSPKKSSRNSRNPSQKLRKTEGLNEDDVISIPSDSSKGITALYYRPH